LFELNETRFIATNAKELSAHDHRNDGEQADQAQQIGLGQQIHRFGSALRCSHHSGETGGICDSQLRQHLAVNADVCFFQATHETAIAHSVDASCSINPCNPQPTEVALAATAVAVGIAKGLHHPLVCGAELGAIATAEAAGKPQDFIAALTGNITSLNAGHTGKGLDQVERTVGESVSAQA
jgi:hypothetical protein